MKKLFLLFAPLALLACNANSDIQDKQLSTIDSLQTVVASIDSSLQTWELVELKRESDSIRELYDFLQKHYPDTTDRNFWVNRLNLTRRTYKSKLKWYEKASQLRDDVELSREQLRKLHNSVEDDQITEEETTDYLAAEKRATQAIHTSYYTHEPEAKIVGVIWDTLGPVMWSIKTDLDSLKN